MTQPTPPTSSDRGLTLEALRELLASLSFRPRQERARLLLSDYFTGDEVFRLQLDALEARPDDDSGIRWAMSQATTATLTRETGAAGNDLAECLEARYRLAGGAPKTRPGLVCIGPRYQAGHFAGGINASIA